MQLKRTKGRPKRQDGDPGRDRLISAARELIRGGSGLDLVGKELAAAAGVTPALVRYYFQDKSSLIEAVARPVIEDYLGRLKDIVHGMGTIEIRFRSLVVLLLTISNENGILLEQYIAYVKTNSKELSNFLNNSFLEISVILQECEETGFLRRSNKAVTATVIWGACKTVGQASELRRMLFPEPASDFDIVERQADLVLALILDGLKPPKDDPPH